MKKMRESERDRERYIHISSSFGKNNVYSMISAGKALAPRGGRAF